jgi:hypothetical protein
MMSNYVACDNPEHDKFSHRIEDCNECCPRPNPRIGLPGSLIDFTGIGRSQLILIIEDLRKGYAELIEETRKLKAESGGLVLKGWWCICDMFNSSGKEDRTECRSCGKAKTVRP